MTLQEAMEEVKSFRFMYMQGVSDNGLKAIVVALAALKTMEWIDKHNFVGHDGEVIAMVEAKFQEFKEA